MMLEPHRDLAGGLGVMCSTSLRVELGSTFKHLDVDGRLIFTRDPAGNSTVVCLVMQNGIWSTGSDDVGLIQSTNAPCFVINNIAPRFPAEGQDHAH